MDVAARSERHGGYGIVAGSQPRAFAPGVAELDEAADFFNTHGYGAPQHTAHCHLIHYM